MDSHQSQPSKQMPRTTTWVTIIIVIALGVGGYFLLKNSGTNTNNNSTTNINQTANVNANTSVNTNTTVDTTGWKTYVNDRFLYSIEHPSDATVIEAPRSWFTGRSPVNAQGLSSDDAYGKYTGKICITLNYHNLGYVLISAPENDQAAYVICGRTGVGVTTSTIQRTEDITIEGKQYTLTGQESTYAATGNEKPDSLDLHFETLVVILADKTRIEMGSAQSSELTFQSYQKIRNALIEIIESYHKT